MPQASVSTKLISETNKENQVCEGFAPLCCGLGYPGWREPRGQQVGAPSFALAFPAPPAPAPAAPESASPGPFASRLLRPEPQDPRVRTLRAPPLPHLCPVRCQARRCYGHRGAGKTKQVSPRTPAPTLRERAGRPQIFRWWTL
ncbi:translation initiation factor IF-2-like [Lemur catta]|uniref:translation initiation factor IF-2-like n=1 Tax=Lemur catta TaxID=9447 RepID=UPI001E26CB55|nr:translation initiation factor IF-2-like [Lemur catta]